MVGPVFRDTVAFLGVAFDVRHNPFKGAIIADELEGGVRADLGDGVDVIAAKQDTEVNELKMSVPAAVENDKKAAPAFYPLQVLQGRGPGEFRGLVPCVVR